MPGIRVVADSACDLPPELVAANRLTIVPLTVRFGAEDATELTSEEFWDKCRGTPVLPETAAPAPGAFAAVFGQMADEGADGVVCICLSSKMSATSQSAEAAAREVADRIPVRVVDSRNVSLGLGLIVLAAADAAAAGAGLDEVAATAEALIPRMRVFATFDTMENLKKGGRIGGARAFLGTVLSIKPVIEVVDGQVEEESKPRTRSRALQYLVGKVTDGVRAGAVGQIGVIHGAAGDIDVFVEMLSRSVPPERLLVGLIGPVIGTHAGLGVIGVTWTDGQ